MASPESEVPPAGTFGPYVPLAKLGEGAFGVVYRVRDARTGAEYALKVLKEHLVARDYVERFLREMQTVAALDDPGIVRVHGSGKTPRGAPWCVMDFVEGEPFSAFLVRRGRLPAREAVARIARIARAVGAAHARGIVHRDMKPANVILGRDGSPKIVDFGLAFLEGTVERLTRPGEVHGTPHYMAPEQIRGEGPPTTATDVWALGVMLFQCVTGRLPFEGGSNVAVIQAVLTREPDLPSSVAGVPAGIDEVFLRCTERSLDRRYRTAVELAQDLEAFVRGEPVTAKGRARARRRAALRRPLLVVAAVAVALLGFFEVTRVLRGRADAAALAALAAVHAGELSKRATLALGSFDPVDRALEALAGPAAEIEELARADLPAEVRSSVAAARPLADLVLRDPVDASEAWSRATERRDAASLALGVRLAVAASDAGAARERLALLDRAGIPAAPRERLELLVLLLAARSAPSLDERVLAGLGALDRGARADQLPPSFRGDAHVQHETLDLAALRLISRIAARQPVPQAEGRELVARLDRVASAMARAGGRKESEVERGRREALRAWADHPGSTAAFEAAERAANALELSFLEGEAAAREGDLARALEFLDVAIQNSPENCDVHVFARSRAIGLLLEAGRQDEAVERLRSAPATVSDNPCIQVARAWCALLARGDVARSMRELESVELLGRRSDFIAHSAVLGEAWLVRGLLRAFKLDDPSAALEDLRRAMLHEETEPRHRALALAVTVMLEGPGSARIPSLRSVAAVRPR